MTNVQTDILARALLDIIRKEYSGMIQIKREITEEQALKVIHERDWSDIFDVSEICGYGVYGREVREEDGKYYVIYCRGDSCD